MMIAQSTNHHPLTRSFNSVPALKYGSGVSGTQITATAGKTAFPAHYALSLAITSSMSGTLESS